MQDDKIYKIKYILLGILPLLTAGLITFPSYYIIASDTKNRNWRVMGHTSLMIFFLSFLTINANEFINNIVVGIIMVLLIVTFMYFILKYNWYKSVMREQKQIREKRRLFKQNNIKYIILILLPIVSLGLLTPVSYYIIAQDIKDKKINYIGHVSIAVFVIGIIAVINENYAGDIGAIILMSLTFISAVHLITFRNEYKDILIYEKEAEEERKRKEKEYNDGWDNSKLNVKRENGTIIEILINKLTEDELILIDNLTYDTRVKILTERELNGIYINAQNLIKRNNLIIDKDIKDFIEKLNYTV